MVSVSWCHERRGAARLPRTRRTRDQYAALLPVLERVSGPEHPHTLTARANLAQWTGEAGDPAAARDQYAALLPVRERVSARSTRTPWPTAPTSFCGPTKQTTMAPREVAPAYSSFRSFPSSPVDVRGGTGDSGRGPA
jgi:hypothetical protein